MLFFGMTGIEVLYSRKISCTHKSNYDSLVLVFAFLYFFPDRRTDTQTRGRKNTRFGLVKNQPSEKSRVTCIPPTFLILCAREEME